MTTALPDSRIVANVPAVGIGSDALVRADYLKLLQAKSFPRELSAQPVDTIENQPTPKNQLDIIYAMNSTQMTKARALELSKGWHDLHDEADAEEAAECHSMAERLRMDALDTEQELRKAGYSAQDLWREIEQTRKRSRA